MYVFVAASCEHILETNRSMYQLRNVTQTLSFFQRTRYIKLFFFSEGRELQSSSEYRKWEMIHTCRPFWCVCDWHHSIISQVRQLALTV